MNMQERSLEILTLNDGNEREFLDFVTRYDANGDPEYYQRCIDMNREGDLVLIMGKMNGTVIGFCLLNKVPKYSYFKKFNMPEVQDLRVAPEFRRNGYGRSLVQYCEELARKQEYDEIGISVGLDSSFGAAQRLYVRMGYIPDGGGITYDRKQVTVGEFKPIDGNLCLMMSKVLKK